MITIHVERMELWDASKHEFLYLESKDFKFENSLKAIAKWEAKWETPFLSKYPEKSNEQLLDFYCCMCLDDDFDIKYLTSDVISKLNNYMNKKHTASKIKEDNKKNNSVITSEYLYAVMIVSNIPLECENWNISRLMMLLSYINMFNTPKKKGHKSSREIAREYSAINKANRSKMGMK